LSFIGNLLYFCAMEKYKCNSCGYVYDPEIGDPMSGIAAGTPFDKLPKDYICPLCGVSKDDFFKLEE